MAKNDAVVKVVKDEGSWGWVLFMAWVGAFVYFFTLDPTFWGFFLALLKSIVWPAFVVYEALGALGVQ
ncbi:TPA: hypothetical protein DCF80_00550 [Candidatus Saccharibacteria bacterium]|nr:hypothetical protein [Candidatus Saccharibacteria bacterium]HRK40900.1 hypothetical protein [Candidatus Saccharibacteria bacterium]